MMIQRPLDLLLSELNNGSQRRARYICVPFSKTCVQVCNKLYHCGLINFYCVSHYLNKVELIIGLRFVAGLPCIREVYNLQSRSKVAPMTFRNICVNWSTYPGCYVFFFTSYGILSLEELYNFQIGGWPLVRIVI